MLVFFGIVRVSFKKHGCERKAKDDRLVARRGHRVQGELCVGGFVCLFSMEILENFIRELEREVKDTDDRENN